LLGTPILARCTYTDEVQLHPRGNTREVQCTHEVQLHQRGTDASMRFNCTYEVQLHLRGIDGPASTAAPTRVEMHLQGTATLTRYSYIYEVQTATPTRHSYTCKIQLPLRSIATPTDELLHLRKFNCQSLHFLN
jgi:hypothetical protein